MQDSQPRQLQKQKYAERQIELLNEFQYTIIQDMQNVLGIALEFHAVEGRARELDPELVKVQKNRLILQYNLSNTIHVDQQQTAESKNMVSEISKQKINAQEMFTKIKQDLYKAMPTLQSSAAGQILEDYHTNNLSLDCKIIQKPLEKTNVKANFNQDVVAQLLGAMQTNDQVYDEIRNSKQLIKYDDAEKIKENALRRYVYAKVKLQEGLEGHEIIVEQNENQKLNPQDSSQSVAEFISLFFSGLANYFAQPIYQSQLMLFGVLQITYEKKIDLQQLNKLISPLLKHLPSFQQLFEKVQNFLQTGDQFHNPCTTTLRNIRITESERNYLKQYQSEQKSNQFWQSKYNQYAQINFILLKNLQDILQNKRINRINFPIQDDYDVFLKKQIIEFHFQYVNSGQTKTLLQQLRDEDQYQGTDFQMTDNLRLDLNYIRKCLQQINK